MLNHSVPNSTSPAADRVLTIPNVISAMRLAIAIGLPFAEAAWRLPLLLLGAVSDWVDGFLAHFTNARSMVGQILDPIADKALALSALLTMLLAGEIFWWQVGLVLWRELAVVVICLEILRRRDWGALGLMRPMMIGKVTTVFLFTWLVAEMIAWPWVAALRTPAFIAASICSFATALMYLRQFAMELRTRPWPGQ